MTGEETPNTLNNLIHAFRRRSTSYLSAAMASDTELYEAQLERYGGDMPKGSSAPDLTEVGLLESMLMGIHEQLQALTHIAAKQKGKPKISHLPRPVTAEQKYKKDQARKAAQHLESVITFVSHERYQEITKEGTETYGHVLRR